MGASPETFSMAVFCDFENIALGVREAGLEKFDIKPVRERLLLKGSIVLKKAYCDWERYKGFKASMHEANFELIEIPHVRQSGKNSADIRMVVDALDLCYTKAHVDTFVIISGDSDFSPLVSKLRENAKYVIGAGVRHSTSDLLIANCDEFIFYDDLVREKPKPRLPAQGAQGKVAAARSGEKDDPAVEAVEIEARKNEAIALAVTTFDALVAERGDSGKIWASMLKSAIKRSKPDFSESYYGFRMFGNLLEEAQARGLLTLGRDEKSGTYVTRDKPDDRLDDKPDDKPDDKLENRPETKKASAKKGAKEKEQKAERAQKAEKAAKESAVQAAQMPQPQVAKTEKAPKARQSGNKTARKKTSIPEAEAVNTQNAAEQAATGDRAAPTGDAQ